MTKILLLINNKLLAEFILRAAATYSVILVVKKRNSLGCQQHNNFYKPDNLFLTKCKDLPAYLTNSCSEDHI